MAKKERLKKRQHSPSDSRNAGHNRRMEISDTRSALERQATINSVFTKLGLTPKKANALIVGESVKGFNPATARAAVISLKKAGFTLEST